MSAEPRRRVAFLVGAALLVAGCARAEPEGARSRVSITLNAPEAAADTVPSVSFHICNQGYQPVERVVFTARTFGAGEATPRELGLDGSPSEFAADLTLPQARCIDRSWEGRFLVLDSVAIEIVDVVGGGA